MTDKSYFQDAEDDYMMTVTTICGPATVFTFNRVISNTDPDKHYPLSSPQPYSPQRTDLNSHQATEQVAIHNKYYRFWEHLTYLKIIA